MEKIVLQEKERKSRKRYFVILFLILLLMSVTVGYSVLSTSLTISGISNIKNNPTWSVYFQNIVVSEGSVKATTEPFLDSTKTKINYHVDLEKSGDYYEFMVDVKNAGSIDARMYNLPVLNGVSKEQDEYINYTIEYADGSPIIPNQILEAGKKRRFKIRIELDSVANKIIQEKEELNLSIMIPYEQA